MSSKHAVSRRKFMGGAATAVGALGFAPGGLQGMLARYAPESRIGRQEGGYDALAKLSSNENPYGPSPAAMKAMEAAWKYSNRYGYPDGDVQEVVADHLGVPRDHVLLTAGSEEVLKAVGIALLGADKKVVGVEPSYGSVYNYATGIDADAIKLPLLDDHSQNVPAMIKATRRHHREIGFVYLCNPNNPTGNVVPASEVRSLLDAIPDDVPVLVDEAYHHFVEDPRYESAVPYVKEGRNVIVARTFSKIYGMAGMRLGFAVAAPPMLQRLRTYATGTINALVKWGGAASIKDVETEAKVRTETLRPAQPRHEADDRVGVRGDSLRDQLLHGADRASRAGSSRRVPRGDGGRGPALPADAGLAPGLGGDRRRDGPLRRRVQEDLLGLTASPRRRGQLKTARAPTWLTAPRPWTAPRPPRLPKRLTLLGSPTLPRPRTSPVASSGSKAKQRPCRASSTATSWWPGGTARSSSS